MNRQKAWEEGQEMVYQANEHFGLSSTPLAQREGKPGIATPKGELVNESMSCEIKIPRTGASSGGCIDIEV